MYRHEKQLTLKNHIKIQQINLKIKILIVKQ